MRSALCRQPGIPTFGYGPHEMREWAGKSGLFAHLIPSHIPNPPNRARESPKVSGHFRENSRLEETEAGDFGSIGHCVPMGAVDFAN